MQDFRYALRSLRKQPIFALVAVATLTLGIGANTAIFSLLYQYMLRPLPYPDAERLVFIWNTYPLMGLQQASVSIPDYIDRKTQASAIEDATLFTMRGLSLAAEGEPVQVRGLAVTPSFFTTLQRQPFLGRAFVEAEAQPGADKFAILTYNLWNSRFAADRSIVGRTVRLGGEAAPDRRRPAGGLRAARPRRGRARAVLVHAAADVRPGARQRVQPDDRAVEAGRDARTGQRADEDHRRSQPGTPAAASGLRQDERLRRLQRADPRPARRRPAHAALLPAAVRPAGALDRVRQRRQPAAHAGDGPIPRARDPHDARRRPAAAASADADRGRRPCRAWRYRRARAGPRGRPCACGPELAAGSRADDGDSAAGGPGLHHGARAC